MDRWPTRQRSWPSGKQNRWPEIVELRGQNSPGPVALDDVAGRTKCIFMHYYACMSPRTTSLLLVVAVGSWPVCELLPPSPRLLPCARVRVCSNFLSDRSPITSLLLLYMECILPTHGMSMTWSWLCSSPTPVQGRPGKRA